NAIDHGVTSGCPAVDERAITRAGKGPACDLGAVEANHAPVAVNDAYTTPQNTALTKTAATGVLANDTDADADTLTAAKTADPAHGVVSLASDGSFTYTPTSGYAGPDAFKYKANDGTTD